MKPSARKFHARLWLILGLALPAVFFAILFARQAPPLDAPAVQLSKPDTQ